MELLWLFILFTRKPVEGRAVTDVLHKSEVCEQKGEGTIGISQ